MSQQNTVPVMTLKQEQAFRMLLSLHVDAVNAKQLVLNVSAEQLCSALTLHEHKALSTDVIAALYR